MWCRGCVMFYSVMSYRRVFVERGNLFFPQGVWKELIHHDEAGQAAPHVWPLRIYLVSALLLVVVALYCH